jgi:hypothetical protein
MAEHESQAEKLLGRLRSFVNDSRTRRQTLRRVKKATKQALSSAHERAERMLEALEHERSERSSWLASSLAAAPPGQQLRRRENAAPEHVPERCDLRRTDGRVDFSCWSALRGMQIEAMSEQWLAASDSRDLAHDFSFQSLLEQADHEFGHGETLPDSAAPMSPAASIERDVHRTFPAVLEFKSHKKRQQLRSVLRAYSVYDTELGYCQGLNFLAALLLCYVDEEVALQALVYLTHGCGFRSCYLPGMRGTVLRLWQLHQLMHELLPKLSQHMSDSAVELALFVTPWLISCFASDFPLNFAGRVVDGVMARQSLVPFFAACVALLQEAEKDLLAISSFEKQLLYLKEKPCCEWSSEKLQKVLSCADELELVITEEKLAQLERKFEAQRENGSEAAEGESEAMQKMMAQANVWSVDGSDEDEDLVKLSSGVMTPEEEEEENRNACEGGTPNEHSTLLE